jgi:hypothetical protein
LLGLVTGAFLFSEYCDEDDEESVQALWEALKDDILVAHIKHEPHTRPWAWWKWEAQEMRRVVGRDKSVGNGRLPAFEDPHLPEWCKQNYFGTPNVYDGYVYESEETYLRRLRLFMPGENADSPV